jgi:uncharacterized protein (TIGR02996 family)
MTTGNAFLADSCDQPADDTPRLVFADWVEDRGDGPCRADFTDLELFRRFPQFGESDIVLPQSNLFGLFADDVERYCARFRPKK